MIHRDLPQVVRISRRSGGLQWGQEDFLAALRGVNTIGHIAEVGSTIVGFLVYKIQRAPEPVNLDEDEPAWSRRTPKTSRSLAGPLLIDLLNIAVAPELHRQGIGRTMLHKLDQKIEREGGRVRAVVPETNLAAQLFLRQGGYRALRVFRRCFEDEDAYLMERHCPMNLNTSSYSQA
jgi:ribosomal protein S18 acetylase RimI-like enzyme